MKFLKYFLLSLALFQGAVFAQYYETSKYSGIGIPFFEVEVFRTFAEDAKSSQILLFYELLYDDLTFIKSDTGKGYVAQFELVAAIYDEEDRGLQSKTLNKESYVTDFDLTNSRTDQIYLNQKFILEPGKYVLKFQLYDLVSKKYANRKINLEIEDYNSKKTALSDLIFISEVDRDTSGNIIGFQPRVKENLSRQADLFYVYHNLYVRDLPATASLTYILEDNKGVVRMDTTIEKEITEHLSAHIWRVDKRDLSKNRYKCVAKLKLAGEEKNHYRVLERQHHSLVTSEKWVTYNDILLKEGLINEVSLVIAPFLTGKGQLDLFRSFDSDGKVLKLKLISSDIIENDYLHLRYKVIL